MFDWISGEQLLVRLLRTDGPQLPVGRDSWDSRLSPVNFRIRRGAAVRSRHPAGERRITHLSGATGFPAGHRQPGKAIPSYRDKIDRFVAKLLEDDSESAMRPIVRPLLAKLGTAKNYDEMKNKVVEGVADMDLEKFRELMACAGFAMNLNGNLGRRK